MFINIGDNIFCIFRINNHKVSKYVLNCVLFWLYVRFLVIFATVQWCSCSWCNVHIQSIVTLSHFDFHWEESVILFSSKCTKFRCFFLVCVISEKQETADSCLCINYTHRKKAIFLGRLLHIHKSCIEHRGFVVLIKIQEECQNPGLINNSLKNSLAEMSRIWNWFEQISDILISSVCASKLTK